MRPLRWYTDPARDALWPAEAEAPVYGFARMFRAYDGSLWEVGEEGLGFRMRRVYESRVRPKPIE